MEIVKCDETIVEKVPNIMSLVYEIFGDSDIAIFAMLDKNKRLGFVARVNEKCVYIDADGQYTLFALNENEDLDRLKKDGYVIHFGDLVFSDSNDKEYMLEMLPLTTRDDEGYNGCISFKQYDPENDVLCDINYQQMYCERDGKPQIYSFHTTEIDAVYIDEKFEQSKGYIKGFPLPKRAKYYTKAAYEDGEIGYEWIKLKDFGLVNFLTNHRNISLEGDRAVRYAKSFYMRLDGSYGDFWPFSGHVKREQIDELIKSYGFLTEVPSLFISVFNGNDSTVNTIQEVVEEMRRIRPILETEEGSCYGMKLILAE